jgi:hypothetical protein
MELLFFNETVQQTVSISLLLQRKINPSANGLARPLDGGL